MEHAFNVEHATKYGVPAAIIIHNLDFWLTKNKANNRHNYEGKYWTYNSIPAFVKLFPYLSYKQIRTTLDTLEKQKVIIKGNFNKDIFDKTNWYTFDPAFIPTYQSNCPTGQTDETYRADVDEPYRADHIIYTDVNTDVSGRETTQPNSEPATPTQPNHFQFNAKPNSTQGMGAGGARDDLLEYLVAKLPNLSGHPALQRILTMVEERGDEARDFIDYVALQKTPEKYIQVNFWKFFISDYWEFKQKGGKTTGSSVDNFELNLTPEAWHALYYGPRLSPLTGLEHLQIKHGIIPAPADYDPTNLNKVYQI
jgi:hypothetical protein